MKIAARLVAAVAIPILPGPAEAAAHNHSALDATGFQPHRDYFSEASFEHIDTLSGSLVLTFTDLVLPGNAGRRRDASGSPGSPCR